MTVASDRLTTLEIRSAEQDKVIEDLSGQIAEQWGVIEKMRKRLDILNERFSALEEHGGADTPITKPPHW